MSGASSFTGDAANRTLTLTLAAGMRLASVIVGTVHDGNNVEGTESVMLTLRSSASYTIDSTRASAALGIFDRPV